MMCPHMIVVPQYLAESRAVPLDEEIKFALIFMRPRPHLSNASIAAWITLVQFIVARFLFLVFARRQDAMHAAISPAFRERACTVYLHLAALSSLARGRSADLFLQRCCTSHAAFIQTSVADGNVRHFSIFLPNFFHVSPHVPPPDERIRRGNAASLSPSTIQFE